MFRSIYFKLFSPLPLFPFKFIMSKINRERGNKGKMGGGGGERTKENKRKLKKKELGKKGKFKKSGHHGDYISIA